MTWQEALMKYGKIAVATGKNLKFGVIKRQGFRKLYIDLTDRIWQGDEEVPEED